MARFKTNRGECYLSEDALHIDESASGYLQHMYEAATSSVRDFLFVSIFVTVLGVNLAIIMAGNVLGVVIGGGIGFCIVGIVYGVGYLRGFRQVETIPLKSITAVDRVEGSAWTHPRYIVSYEEDGATHKRRIKLPSRYLSFSEKQREPASQLFSSIEARKPASTR